jgi:hypothetical protein
LRGSGAGRADFGAIPGAEGDADATAGVSEPEARGAAGGDTCARSDCPPSKIANTSAITTQVNAILGGIAGKARIVARDIGEPIVAAAESGGGK